VPGVNQFETKSRDHILSSASSLTDKRFFAFALRQCGLKKHEVLFVGNQLNTDIKGAVEYGIQNAWLSGPEYMSPDDTLAPSSQFRHRAASTEIPKHIKPSQVIRSLQDLPPLLEKLNGL
jgi:FMN phosphatase YigB (HAD superfamily)